MVVQQAPDMEGEARVSFTMDKAELAYIYTAVCEANDRWASERELTDEEFNLGKECQIGLGLGRGAASISIAERLGKANDGLKRDKHAQIADAITQQQEQRRERDRLEALNAKLRQLGQMELGFQQDG